MQFKEARGASLTSLARAKVKCELLVAKCELGVASSGIESNV